jgi:hypothetical protein
MRFIKFVSWLGFIALTLLLAWNPTAFRTKAQLHYDGTTLRADFDKQSLAITRPGLSVKRLALEAGPSFFPTGGDYLIWQADPSKAVTHQLPQHFTFAQLNFQPAGDWWIDEKYETEEVWSRPVEHNGNFKIELQLRERSFQFIKLQLQGEDPVTLLFRRGLINNDATFQEASQQSLGSITLTPAWQQSLLHIIDPYLRGLWLASLMALILSYLPFQTKKNVSIPSSHFQTVLLWVLISFSFFLSCWIALEILKATPHFQDDMCYLIRAKWLLAGQPFPDAPLLPEHFQIPFTYISDGKWATVYPIGWPLFLALGESFGAAWILSPLFATLSLWLIWKLGECLGELEISVVSLLLVLTCTLCWIFSASMMTHAVSPCLIALSLWCFYQGETRALSRWSFFGGIALGLLFGIRPMTSVAVGMVLALFALGKIKTTLRLSLAFAAGVFIGALPVLIDNWIVTGKPWLFAYSVGYDYKWTWKTLDANLLVTDSTMALLLPHAFSWPIPLLGLALALIPFFTGLATRLHWILLCLYFSIPLAYSGIIFNGAHGFGPRYYFDVIFCLFLLAAHGFNIIGQRLSGLAYSLPSRSWLLVGLILLGFSTTNVIQNLPRYQYYNGIQQDLITELEKKQISHALILIPSNNEMLWVKIAPRLPGTLQDKLIFAADLGDNTSLLKQYDDRPAYRWSASQLHLLSP